MNPYCGPKRDWFNDKGYYDPTVGQALASVSREEKARAWKPCVFICSPYAGDVAENTRRAKKYMRFAVDEGAIPFAPHLLYPQVLNEEDAKERELGLFFGTVWLGKCEELWVFGDIISKGMAREIAWAAKRGLIIRYFTEECEEIVERR